MVLTYDAYNETVEEKQIKDKEVENLRNQMVSMQEAQARNFGFTKGSCETLQVLK